ncbi:MAG: tetratricopeptide repeat protein, partial [Bacteroidota bacterium]
MKINLKNKTLRTIAVYLAIIFFFSFLSTEAFLSSVALAKVDSLKKVIETADHACPEPCRGDSTKVKALNTLAWELRISDLDTAKLLTEQALAIADKAEYLKGKASAYNTLRSINWRQSNYDKAIEYANKTLKIYESLGDKQGMASSYNNIGIIYDEQSDYPLALEYYFKSLKIQEELGNKQGMAISYNNIGNIYANQ